MVRIALVRHAPTDWNAARRLQGRTDTPLSAEGRALATEWRLPPEIIGFDWLASPLRRTCETAALLGAPPELETDPRLMEMSWGQWEGRTLADLRAEFGPMMGEWERLGLDFRAEGGESPRQVQIRVRPLLEELAAAGRDRLLVTHKGVMRAVLALATGWDMTGKPPHKMQEATVHLYRLSADGLPTVERMNLPLGAALAAGGPYG